ncbi:MAG: bacterial transcriptional activator domain-containing protein [Ignavibacteria bacterium]|nr:bacterial transcriptional activator domain-containing protein [Ignavibacteria bacterium]
MRQLGLCCLAWIGLIASAMAQTVLPDARLHALVLQGIDLDWQGKHRQADSLFQETIREFPNHPAGYVYRAGVMQSKAMDHEMQVDEARFDSLIRLGKEKAEGLLERDGEAKWGHFFVGTAEGYDSYARVYRGDWLSGALRGIASVSSFKDAIRLDSSMYDAYGGVGAFNYWRSRRTEYFNWIPFIGDARPEAFAFLKKTIDRGLYNRYTALSMLAAIYDDAGLHDKALECSRAGLERYPANQVFLWALATAWQKLGNSREAANAYERLLRAFAAEKENNRYHEIVCRLNLSRFKLELGDTLQVRENLVDILKFHKADFPVHLQSRAQEKLDQAKELLRKGLDGHSFTE